ncbi:methyltransferase [Mycobacterium sp. C31M]
MSITDFDPETMGELRRRCDLSFPYAVRAAVTLKVAEHLSSAPRTTVALADLTGTQPWALGKVLARLAAEGYLDHSSADRSWSLTAAGAILTSPHVRGALAADSGHAQLDAAWPGLLHTVRTGEAGYPQVVGRSYWDTVAQNPTLGETFDTGLSQWAGQWSGDLAALIGAEFDGHIVDVGGGVGRVLADVLTACPRATGTVVELPSTAARAREFLGDSGFGDRAGCVEQSFFEPLPAGQVYLLTQILHDWPDAESALILRRLAEAVGVGRILIVERVHDELPGADEAAFDLLMNVVFGGGERSPADYAALANTAGLRLLERTVIGAGMSVLEFAV